MGNWKREATERLEAERLAELVLSGHCPECGGLGYDVYNDPELGIIYTGCGTCWWVREEHEERMAQEELSRQHEWQQAQEDAEAAAAEYYGW